MPFEFSKLWFEPRRSSLRHWMFQVHKWAGVGVGLYLAMMGLTGSMSVFLPELRNTLVSPIHVALGQQGMSLQALQTSIETNHPAFHLRAVYPGQSATWADTFEEQAEDKTIREIVINPYTAQVLADRRRGTTLYDRARDLHANLLSGKTGKAINGFGGILLLLTGLTGLVIWWSGRRHLKANTFRVATHKGWHRLSFDLHRLVGVLVILPLSVAAITGVSLAFPQVAASAVSVVLGPRNELLRAKSGKVDDARHITASLDAVLQTAIRQVPGAIPTRIQAPDGKYGGYLVWMHLPNDWRDEGDNRVLIDGSSARLLDVQIGRDMAPSSRVIEAATAIHYGQYGGISTRIFAVLTSLTLPLFFITGITLWWRRVFRQRPRPMVQTVSSVTLADDVYAVETQ